MYDLVNDDHEWPDHHAVLLHRTALLLRAAVIAARVQTHLAVLAEGFSWAEYYCLGTAAEELALLRDELAQCNG